MKRDMIKGQLSGKAGISTQALAKMGCGEGMNIGTYVEQEDKREKIDIIKPNAKVEEIVA